MKMIEGYRLTHFKSSPVFWWSEIREDAERDLAAAIPAVEKAMEALNTLDKKDLAEAKT